MVILAGERGKRRWVKSGEPLIGKERKINKGRLAGAELGGLGSLDIFELKL